MHCGEAVEVIFVVGGIGEGMDRDRPPLLSTGARAVCSGEAGTE